MGRHHTHSGLSFLALAAAPQFPWDPREDLQEALKGGTYRVPSTRFPSTRHAFTLGEGLLVLGSLCVLWDCVAAALVWWAGLWGCQALRTCDPGSCRSVAVVRGTGEGLLGGFCLFVQQVMDKCSRRELTHGWRGPPPELGMVGGWTLQGGRRPGGGTRGILAEAPRVWGEVCRGMCRGPRLQGSYVW